MTSPVVLRTLRFGTPLGLLAFWWFWSNGSESLYFPPLSDVLDRFVEVWTGPAFRNDLVPSVVRFVVGFALALIIAIPLGTAFGLSSRLRRDALPLTEFSRSLPVAAIVPIPLLAFGPGFGMDVSLILFSAIFPILLATTDGVRGVDPQAVETARVYGLNMRQVLREVILPAAMPPIFAGIRVALAIGISAMVIAGMLSSSQGIGAYVILAQQSFDVLGTWAGLVMIGLLGIVINGTFLLIQSRVLAWHTGWRRAAKEGS
ncbi:hypothetical protein ASG90_01005 [Nocardioides sp. Soil797]|nr:hypothetical protein ASG90_01005 [Nocardioides sp. Soil797]